MSQKPSIVCYLSGSHNNEQLEPGGEKEQLEEAVNRKVNFCSYVQK